MSSSVYDPRKFEFVARMGRISGPENNNKNPGKVPVTFRIPNPPEQEIVSVPLGRSMRAEPFVGSGNNKPLNLDDFTQDLPQHVCSEDKAEFKDEKKNQLKLMLNERKEKMREREMRQHAQHLVNEALLQKELEVLKNRDSHLEEIMESLNNDGTNNPSSKQVDMSKATIFEEAQPPNRSPVDVKMQKYIQQELERLVPVIKDDKK